MTARPGRPARPPAVDEVLRERAAEQRARDRGRAGRVIGQLVGDPPPSADGDEAPAITWLALDDVAPSPENPRQRFDEAGLAALAESIKAHGVLEPILVRPWPALGAAGARTRGLAGFVLVAGERRWRAARLAGLKRVPAIVKHGLTEEAALRLALIENLQRVDLDPIEEAEGYRRLTQLGMRQREIAAAVHVTQSQVAHRMALVGLPDDVRHKVASGALSPSHGEALASLKGFPALQEHLGRLAVEGGYTSAQLEKGAQQGGLLGEGGVQEALQRAGVLVRLGYGAPFDVHATCAAPGACPFGAYRRAAYGQGLCLRPEHYRELVREAERERRAKEASGGASGGAPPKLEDLPADYVRLSWKGRLPEGCEEACACRAQALDYRGEPVAVCTDPKRFRGLEAAQTRRERHARLQATQGARDALLGRLEGLEAIGGRDLALLAAESLYRMAPGREDGLREAVLDAGRRWCPEHAEAIAAAKPWEYDGWRRADVLAGVSALALVRVVLWATLTLELDQRVRYADGRAGRVDWYLQAGQPDGERPGEGGTA